MGLLDNLFKKSGGYRNYTGTIDVKAQEEECAEACRKCFSGLMGLSGTKRYDQREQALVRTKEFGDAMPRNCLCIMYRDTDKQNSNNIFGEYEFLIRTEDNKTKLTIIVFNCNNKAEDIYNKLVDKIKKNLGE